MMYYKALLMTSLLTQNIFAAEQLPVNWQGLPEPYPHQIRSQSAQDYPQTSQRDFNRAGWLYGGGIYVRF